MKSACFLFLVDVRQRYYFSHLSWSPIIIPACVSARVHKSVCACVRVRHMIDYQEMTSHSRNGAQQHHPVVASPHDRSPLLLPHRGPLRSLRCVQRPAGWAAQTDVITRSEMTGKLCFIFHEFESASPLYIRSIPQDIRRNWRNFSLFLSILFIFSWSKGAL